MQERHNVHAHHHGGGSLRWATAKHALRCLIGCNIGEGTGAAIGFLLGWDMALTLALAVGLAFAVGYAFTMIPMLRTMPWKQAAKVTVIGDTASISAMEVTENLLAFMIPGFMMATLADAIFWLGLGIILPAGFAVSYPAMYWAMKREQQKKGGSMQQAHQHNHH
ncbi:DUF4396 domain-containing protein [Nitrososphaera viennensis]|uniref:DUF4396 domain-containing protein n=2 Tax=Nitrososphaera viennensis TaxID=1034015 RepID=A0A060HF71_9ARCH|nr:DUF4396 domain-containing protein [Nitrososphaera viennensis]AIC15289.1 hypothetical protein NVIE_010630 [Nitrososphaera viennensis EN76]UVS70193.1 DUF4396 domain-containing protein [Nitrososphaera viennensis]